MNVPPERRPIGVVFQDLLLFPHLSALENVAFPLLARGVARAEAHDRGEHLLVGSRWPNAPAPSRATCPAARPSAWRSLAPSSSSPRCCCSTSPCRRSTWARARLREVLRDELERFPGIRVLITHDPVEASTMADRIVIVEDGRVTQIGTPEEIRSAPRSGTRRTSSG